MFAGGNSSTPKNPFLLTDFPPREKEKHGYGRYVQSMNTRGELPGIVGIQMMIPSELVIKESVVQWKSGGFVSRTLIVVKLFRNHWGWAPSRRVHERPRAWPGPRHLPQPPK